MVDFPKYESYKDSGVEWLGAIPSHWDIKRNLGLFDERKEVNQPNMRLLSVTIEKGVIKQSESLIKKDSSHEDKSKYKVVRQGDLAYNKMRMWQGAIGRSNYDGIVSPAYIILNTHNKSYSKYFHYLYRTELFIREANRHSYGLCSDMNSLRYEDFKTIFSPVPPEKEAKEIVKFLDRKTAEIDQAIAQKQRLIELLQEQKAILINQAVTKGLDPNVPMCDRGIEWLGEVPKHWKVMRLKYLLNEFLKYGANEEAREQEYNDPRYIRITDFGEDGKLRDDTFRSLPLKKATEYLLKDEDILFARSGATVGKTFFFDSYQGKACFAGYLIKASVNKKKMLPRFLYLYTKSPAFEAWKDLIFSKSTMPNIGADKYALLPVPTPSKQEQEEITNKIISDCKQIDEVIYCVLREIDTLIELKSIVISNAVTGKIKV